MTETASLDPITLEILFNALRSVTDETFIALMQSAYSTNIKERRDHSTAICDADGPADRAGGKLAADPSRLDDRALMAAICAKYRSDDIARGRHLRRQRSPRGRRHASARHQHGAAGLRRTAS